MFDHSKSKAVIYPVINNNKSRSTNYISAFSFMTARNYKKSKIQLVDQLYGEVSVISEKKSISN